MVNFSCCSLNNSVMLLQFSNIIITFRERHLNCRNAGQLYLSSYPSSFKFLLFQLIKCLRRHPTPIGELGESG